MSPALPVSSAWEVSLGEWKDVLRMKRAVGMTGLASVFPVVLRVPWS